LLSSSSVERGIKRIESEYWKKEELVGSLGQRRLKAVAVQTPERTDISFGQSVRASIFLSWNGDGPKVDAAIVFRLEQQRMQIMGHVKVGLRMRLVVKLVLVVVVFAVVGGVISVVVVDVVTAVEVVVVFFIDAESKV